MPVDVQPLGKYLAQELKQYDTEFYRAPENQLWGALGLYVPSVGDLKLGVREFESYRRRDIGRASVSDGNVTYDIPLVDFSIKGTKIKTLMVWAGAEWDITQIAENQIANSNAIKPTFNLVDAKQDSIKTAVDRRIHELVYAGEPDLNFFGLFNSPLLTTTDESAFNPITATPTALYDWWQNVIENFSQTSKLDYSQISAYVSKNLHRVTCKRFTDGTGQNVKGLLLGNTDSQYIKEIKPINELAPATLAALGIVPNANTGLMILGNFSEDRAVKRHFYDLDRTDPFVKGDTGVHFGVTGWAATSEIDFKIPEYFTYVRYNATP